jgi:hypothetical protein
MTNSPRYASLYQINTRVWLTELSHALGRPATVDDIPDAELDFDWVWFLSVWQTGPAAQALARADRKWLSRLITRRETPENFNQALERKTDDIKVVIQFTEV